MFRLSQLTHAPWLSWLQRPTVIPRERRYRKVVSSSLTGADLFCTSQVAFVVIRDPASCEYTTYLKRQPEHV